MGRVFDFSCQGTTAAYLKAEQWAEAKESYMKMISKLKPVEERHGYHLMSRIGAFTWSDVSGGGKIVAQLGALYFITAANWKGYGISTDNGKKKRSGVKKEYLYKSLRTRMLIRLVERNRTRLKCRGRRRNGDYERVTRLTKRLRFLPMSNKTRSDSLQMSV